MESLRYMSLALTVLITAAKPSNIPGPNGLYTKVFRKTYNLGTSSELYTYTPDLSTKGIDDDIESVHQTGIGQSFTGPERVCVYPATFHDRSPSGEQLDVGIYGVVTTLGLPEDSIRSIRKGCWSSKVATPSDLSYQHKDSNGGWGYVGL
ncbi:uncharacterized protein LOC135203274 [Macrobrachium nipponense]|uniref:uncharacterized protein LOC135203274 n=1 Tax=Macrobrachium nipponense TaxID=159736 RepID=UPI0030C8C685